MSEISLMLGEVRGELRALRVEHDRHTELARENFRRIEIGLDELRADKIARTAQKAARQRIATATRWAATIAVAALSGNLTRFLGN